MKKYIIFVLLLNCISIYAQYQLPIIKLNGNFGYEYQEGTISIYYTDGTSQESLTGKIKWRGGSTNTDEKHKRNHYCPRKSVNISLRRLFALRF